MELVKDNRREIEQNRREIEAHNQELLDQNDTLQQIVLAAQHYEEEFMERVVGDQRSN